MSLIQDLMSPVSIVDGKWTASTEKHGRVICLKFAGEWNENPYWCAVIDGLDSKYVLHRGFLPKHTSKKAEVGYWSIPEEPCYIAIGLSGIAGSGKYYFVSSKGKLSEVDESEIITLLKLKSEIGSVTLQGDTQSSPCTV